MKLPAGYVSVEDWAIDLVRFMNQPVFKQLSGGIHVIDFFVYGVWEHLPEEWTAWFSTLENEMVRKDLISGIDGPSPLLRFSEIYAGSVSHGNTPPLAMLLYEQFFIRESGQPLRQMQVLSRQVSLGMKPKKMHEVGHFASLVGDIGQRCSIKRAIDIGAGQGYLSRTLAKLYDFNVLAIDGQEAQLEGAKNLSASVCDSTQSGKIEYLVKLVKSDDLPDVHAWGDGEASVVVALHACGSLTEDALRVFLQNEHVTACAVIGCCYNHIRTRADGHADGFPLSTRLADLSVDLDGTARMLACQAPANWTPDTSASFFSRHFFRALFQLVAMEKGLVALGPSHETKMVIGGLPKQAYDFFPTYVAACLKKLGFPSDAVTTEEATRYMEVYGPRQDQIRIAWTLSAILAPLLESVILLDRYLFLKEQGICDVEIVPCFDYAISPRNMVIVARK